MFGTALLYKTTTEMASLDTDSDLSEGDLADIRPFMFEPLLATVVDEAGADSGGVEIEARRGKKDWYVNRTPSNIIPPFLCLFHFFHVLHLEIARICMMIVSRCLYILLWMQVSISIF